jgi:organic radical activating enzyme
MSSDSVEDIKDLAPIINDISPTFCLAKWYHSGIYLHTGQTHSCYHPRPHEIPKDDLIANPSSLHNTPIKKQERALMLVGEKPDGCQYCWNVESLSDTHISDRMIRNNSIYTPERVEEVNNNNWNFNVNPEYIEIAFSNECNFKCGYCHPMSSTSFQAEIKKFGPYDTVKNHRLDIDWFKPYKEEDNPYIKAWWDWWPEMSKKLNILRITGGEPLTHRSTWSLLERLKDDPRPHLELNINSNLGIKTSLVEKLALNVNSLINENKIKRFKLFSSMDTWGDRAEYIRTGLKLDLWEHNLDTYVTMTKSPVAFMCTFNILSVTSFDQFLSKVLYWRKKYDYLFEKNDNTRMIRFDTPYLKEPLQYDIQILPKNKFLPHFDRVLKFIDENRDENDRTKFSDLEYERFRRVRDYFSSVDYDEAKVKEGRKDFYNWFTEYDRRRNTNFLETFPDMLEFWEECKNIDSLRIPAVQIG